MGEKRILNSPNALPEPKRYIPDIGGVDANVMTAGPFWLKAPKKKNELTPEIRAMRDALPQKLGGLVPASIPWGHLTTEWKEKIKQRAFIDHAFYTECFFPEYFWGVPSQMHKDFIKWEQKPTQKGIKEITAAPRGHAKTTWRALFKPIHAILYAYHQFILVIGYSGPDGNDKTRDIRDQLLNNDRLIEVFGKVIPENAGATDFVATVTKGDVVNKCRVLARSTGKQVRGLRYKNHRPTLVICDDILSAEGVATPEQRAKTYKWFFSDVMGALETTKTETGQSTSCVSVIGTSLNKDDLINSLLKTAGWRTNKYRALLRHADRQDLWTQWERIYIDLDNPTADVDAKAFYEANKEEMDRGSQVLWDAGDNYYALRVFIIQNGKASFNSEKQNDPHDPTQQVLYPEKCARFETILVDDPRWPVDMPRDGWAFVMGEVVRPYTDLERVIIAHDPALAKTNSSDFAAIVALGQDYNGYIYALEAWIERKNYWDQVNKALDLALKWGADTIYMEQNNFQGILKEPYADAKKQRSQKTKVIGVTSHTNKQGRIARLQPYIDNHVLRLSNNINRRLVEQLEEFPLGHDDGPDCLELGIARLRKPRTIAHYSQGEKWTRE